MFKRFALVLLALGISSAAFLSPVARAQSNYPPNATLEIRDENGNIVVQAVFVGDRLHVHSTGWGIRVLIQATWFSDPVDLGKHETDGNGDLDFDFEVPNTPPIPGTHTLRLEGTGANGQFRRVEGPIDVKPRSTSGTTSTTVAGGGNGNGNGNGSGGNGNGSSVLGSTLNNTSGSGSGGSAVAKTGAFIGRTAYVGFALLTIGAALFLAVRKRNTAPAR